MVVNHNMAAICESRQLRYNVKKMEKSSKKLATGYKLNTANDDQYAADGGCSASGDTGRPGSYGGADDAGSQ